MVQEQRARITIQKPNGPFLQVLQCHSFIIIRVHGRYTIAVDS